MLSNLNNSWIQLHHICKLCWRWTPVVIIRDSTVKSVMQSWFKHQMLAWDELERNPHKPDCTRHNRGKGKLSRRICHESKRFHEQVCDNFVWLGCNLKASRFFNLNLGTTWRVLGSGCALVPSCCRQVINAHTVVVEYLSKQIGYLKLMRVAVNDLNSWLSSLPVDRRESA